MIYSELFSAAALPPWLKQSLGVDFALGRHCCSEADVFRAIHYNFQLMASLQKLLPWGLVAFRREGDPVEASAQLIHPAGFQMQGETASRIEGLGEGLQIVMQRLSTGDHNEAGPGFSRYLGGVSQGIGGLLRVPLAGP